MNYRQKMPAHYEKTLAFFSVNESDASVEVVSGGGTASWDRPDQTRGDFVLAGRATSFAFQTLEFVRGLSLAVGYLGLWRVGVHITNLRGKALASTQFGAYFPPFPADSYIRTRVLSVTQLENLDSEVTALMRGFHRALGVLTGDVG